MTFANEILEIDHDLGDTNPLYSRMDKALNGAGASGLDAIQRRVRELCWDLLPRDMVLAPTTQAHDEVEAMMAAIFTIGVLYGREHHRRGYTLPE